VHHFSHEKVLDNRRKKRCAAQNWSVDVFLSVLNDFPGKNFSQIFPKTFAPIFDFLIKISDKLVKTSIFSEMFSGKIAKKTFVRKII